MPYRHFLFLYGEFWKLSALVTSSADMALGKSCLFAKIFEKKVWVVRSKNMLCMQIYQEDGIPQFVIVVHLTYQFSYLGHPFSVIAIHYKDHRRGVLIIVPPQRPYLKKIRLISMETNYSKKEKVVPYLALPHPLIKQSRVNKTKNGRCVYTRMWT